MEGLPPNVADRGGRSSRQLFQELSRSAQPSKASLIRARPGLQVGARATDVGPVSSGSAGPSGRALLALFTVSGASGLTFQVIWARQLGTVVGATTQAITAVVAIFMAGLALGGLLGARLAPRL